MRVDSPNPASEGQAAHLTDSVAMMRRRRPKIAPRIFVVSQDFPVFQGVKLETPGKT